MYIDLQENQKISNGALGQRGEGADVTPHPVYRRFQIAFLASFQQMKSSILCIETEYIIDIASYRSYEY